MRRRELQRYSSLDDEIELSLGFDAGVFRTAAVETDCGAKSAPTVLGAQATVIGRDLAFRHASIRTIVS